MTKLLYIKASPRHTASRSIAVTDSYLAALRAKTTGLVVDEIELWEAGLPECEPLRVFRRLQTLRGWSYDREKAKTALFA